MGINVPAWRLARLPALLGRTDAACDFGQTAVRLLDIGWNVDVSEAARNLQCPVLVIHPERDSAVPLAEGRLLASLIPDCRFVQLDTQNYMPLLDEPAWPRLISEIRTFLATSDGSMPEQKALPLDNLTPRERAILEGIAGGLDNADIARSLGLS